MERIKNERMKIREQLQRKAESVREITEETA
jgi:hypothetical protein